MGDAEAVPGWGEEIARSLCGWVAAPVSPSESRPRAEDALLPTSSERGNGHREVTVCPELCQAGLPTLLHELPPAPGPLGELLRVRLLDARPLVQAVHEVAAQAVAVVDPLHGPLVVPDLGDGRAGRDSGQQPTCQTPGPHCCPTATPPAPHGSALSHWKAPHVIGAKPRLLSAAGTTEPLEATGSFSVSTWPVSTLAWGSGRETDQLRGGTMEGSEGA